MILTIRNDGEDTNLERVEYFEVGTNGTVLVERDGESERHEGEVIGGSDL